MCTYSLFAGEAALCLLQASPYILRGGGERMRDGGDILINRDLFLSPQSRLRSTAVAITDCSPLWLKTCHRHVFLTRRARLGTRGAFTGDEGRAGAVTAPLRQGTGDFAAFASICRDLPSSTVRYVRQASNAQKKREIRDLVPRKSMDFVHIQLTRGLAVLFARRPES